VARATGGAFDVTVGPLVDLWSFGSEKRARLLPSDDEIQQRKEWVGYERLQVRLDPPAIKKSIPNLRVDLSAIAKGHGVDRVVDVLRKNGAQHVFVEIGGEVRVTGDKAGQPWVVGIERPDSEASSVMIRYPIRDASMATSGDYRNRFEVDGTYYSHTIDPHTGRPITHGTASVTVVAEDCMTADAWATAINVLGPKAGIEAAKKEGISVFIAARTAAGFSFVGTGELEQFTETAQAEMGVNLTVPSATAGPPAQPTAVGKNPLVATLVITALGLGLAVTAMAIGVLFGRRPISGSCGGLAGTINDDGTTRCSLCSNPVDGCRELRERMQVGGKVSEKSGN
jgi:thiamine biosynthesis lipoprotein